MVIGDGRLNTVEEKKLTWGEELEQKKC